MNPTSERTIRILIVDDQVVVRQGIRAYLSSFPDLEIVAEAGSGESAIKLALEHHPDVALVDLVMPGMGGVETTRQIQAASPETKIVVLTCHYQDQHIFPALQAGATSYLLKDIKMDKLAEAVRRAAQGIATLHPSVEERIRKKPPQQLWTNSAQQLS
jgi:NarL family two-component system response regulator LiaR